MLDPQRNLLTVILVGTLGVLGLTAVVMLFWLGRVDIDRIATGSTGEVAEVEVDVPETGLGDFEDYTGIMERPVFFSDRRLPVVELAENGEDDDAPVDNLVGQEDVADLKATVAGIVITPEMKLAMVSDQAAGKTFVLREGMSLEGEQAAWKLESILPRAVSFVSVDGRKTELELKVHTSGLTVGTAPATRRTAAAGRQPEDQPPEELETEETAEQVSDEARARAEEIRRRVAERRAELRAEAERRARQQQSRDNNG